MPDPTKNILVIEDNLPDYMLLEHAINLADPAFHITWVNNGKDASVLIKSLGDQNKTSSINIPQVIFLDINLPLVNGKELLQLIRSQDDTKSIYVIVVSHSQVESEITTLTELGADLFLYKELDIDLFSKKIEQTLRKLFGLKTRDNILSK